MDDYYRLAIRLYVEKQGLPAPSDAVLDEIVRTVDDIRCLDFLDARDAAALRDDVSNDDEIPY